MANKPYYFYVILAADKTLYGGFTDDVGKRFAAHQAFKGAKFTKIKSKHPLELIYAEAFDNKHDALSAEWHFKHQLREKKVGYLAEHGVDVQRFAHRK
ncbi:GIY-YIG nuclease family protein [Periweissella cryptocerci]|uniref:GIY-YIG nuclease family protein n=1 Tax=Periweissella cryptocerci TaxID=2506420 RepID=A0A4P6YRV5_9LACO|nr:GIY-YIG nuclease family protein [Periweissella cryptocerci]QBO35333.1 GIY-YIG nuclease family protein [Periweissella cryptocerci]